MKTGFPLSIRLLPASLIGILILFLAGCLALTPPPATEVSIPTLTSSPAPTATHPALPWREEEINFEFGSDQLFGILTLPGGEGPFPAVVLISGSANPSTGKRNGASAPHQVSHARAMARAGFAVLRYDPPGVGRSGGITGYETLQLRSEEAVAALHFLQTRQEIHPDRIGLWGVSQGSWVISIAAAEYPREVAFLISVSGAGVSVADQQLHGIEYESRNANFSEEEISKAILFGRLLIDWQLQEPIYETINRQTAHSLGEGPWDRFMDLVYGESYESLDENLQEGIVVLESIQDEPWTAYLYLKELYLPSLKSVPPGQVALLRAQTGPALLEDPRDYLTRVTCPVLAIFGEEDLLQPTERSAALFEQYLTRAGNSSFKIVILPGEGHASFINNQSYLELMTDWLNSLY